MYINLVGLNKRLKCTDIHSWWTTLTTRWTGFLAHKKKCQNIRTRKIWALKIQFCRVAFSPQISSDSLFKYPLAFFPFLGNMSLLIKECKRIKVLGLGDSRSFLEAWLCITRSSGHPSSEPSTHWNGKKDRLDHLFLSVDHAHLERNILFVAAIVVVLPKTASQLPKKFLIINRIRSIYLKVVELSTLICGENRLVPTASMENSTLTDHTRNFFFQ